MTPFVFLHGFTGSPRAVAAISGQIPLGRRLLAPCLLGHDPGVDSRALAGDLASIPSGQRYDREVDRIAALFNSDSLEGAHVCGYSLGARIALALAIRHPALVSRLTLVGGQPGLEGSAEREVRRQTDETWCRVLETEGIEAFADAWQAQPLFATQNQLPGEVRERQLRERLAHSPAGLALSLRHTGLAEMPNYWPKLASLTVPVDLVVGALDTKFRAIGARMQHLLPNARLHVIAEAGHNVVLERPRALVSLLAEET